MEKYDFTGWATRANLKCADGRVIMPDAFKDDDQRTVPLVWNHNHSSVENILGHALLENRGEGVYAYCVFNDNESGKMAKETVQHGDIVALSILANKIKQHGSNVMHGIIREVSLVLAGANPGAYIEAVLEHGEESEEAAIIYTGEPLILCHSDDSEKDEDEKDKTKKSEEDEEEDKDMADTKGAKKESEKKETEKTIEDIINSMTEEQRNVLYALVDKAMEDTETEDKEKDEDEDEEKTKGDGKTMKHNVFDQEDYSQDFTLSHADEVSILETAKNRNVGTLKNAMQMFVDDNKDALAHGIDNVEALFPEYQLETPGEPGKLTRDYGWVSNVISKAHKTPFSRVKTRHADVRAAKVTALGYKKANEKAAIPNWELISRTTDPQTIYVKDTLDRDDVLDITDFDVVSYQQQIMRELLEEKLAVAIMIGDGLESGADGKISEDHIRPIWKDDELYTIHYDVDIDATKTSLQGTGTEMYFGENYIYAEAIVTAALYARENYRGSGNLEFYCTPHLLNVMLLARDLNGRRQYNSADDLAKALNVTAIHTVEQFENQTRSYTPTGESTPVTKKLLGLFVNMVDYNIGAVKGGEITSMSDFDIDFNQHKYLMETRVSGALTKPYAAIALEETVTSTTSSDTSTDSE